MRFSSRAAGCTLVGIATLTLAVTTLAAPGSAATAPRQAPATHVNDCWSSDNGRPVVDSLDITPSAADTDAGPVQVQLTVQAHDTGGPGPATGVRSVGVQLTPQGPYQGPTGPPYLSTSLTQSSDGSWQGSVTVPAHTSATYDAEVYAGDRAGDRPLSTGLGAVPLARDNALTVTGTDPYAGDTVKPTLTDLTLSTDAVDTRKHARKILVEATATDDSSGVAQVSVQPLGLDSRGKPDGPTGPAITLRQVTGTDQFRGALPYPRWRGNHRETLNVYVTDRAGNVRRYRPPVLADQGFPSRITVVSGPLNHDAPRVVRVLRAARSIDVRTHARWYPVRVVLADPQGVRSSRIRLFEDGPLGDLHRVSGTARRGVWAGRVRVLPCSPGPVTVLLHVRTVDGQGFNEGREPRSVRVVTADHTRPVATTHWRETPHVFTWSEPVHGISSSNVTVYDDNPDDPQPLAASWTCRDPQGRDVDCLTGPVKKATFTLDDPDSGNPGVVRWSPEHHLDVLDAHGNPADYTIAPYVVD